MPKCQKCETSLDLNWYYCPNCGRTTTRTESKPRNVDSVESSPRGMSGQYGRRIREQVFEVIVGQAMSGAPWREICSGPMQVNQISVAEIEAEVRRRQAEIRGREADEDGGQPSRVPKKPKQPDDDSSNQLALPPSGEE
jgi:hypothetical protein